MGIFVVAALPSPSMCEKVSLREEHSSNFNLNKSMKCKQVVVHQLV